MNLSVVIITFNEEKNIERCLKSVAPIADEIVVVDSLSTDTTKDLCSKYNVRFISQAFLGYIEQKNFALQQASNNDVLSLDADEELSDELCRSIRSAKENNFPFDAYSMNRCSSFCGKWIKHGSWYPDKKTRLLDKTKGKWAGINPHDKLRCNPAAAFII